MRRGLVRCGVAMVIVAAVAVLYQGVWRGSGDPLVVYCAHDAIFSRSVLAQFEKRTGITVDVYFDDEATKSLGLTQRIIAEGDRPICNVFWNNQMLGTMDLAQRGLLEPYKGPGYERMAGQYKDTQGLYTGFSARLRVYIINTEKMEATEEAVQKALEGDLSHVAIAKPMWGTTLTHFSVLADLWGLDRVRAWHADWQDRGAVQCQSNAMVKDLVAQGTCTLGLTDTDDFFVARDAGKQVSMLPVRLPDAGGRVICIANTVAIIKGSKRLDHARQLVDFLLSQEVELWLARSKARQIPLGPVDESKLSPMVRQLRRWAERPYDLTGVNEARRAVLDWLKSEHMH